MNTQKPKSNKVIFLFGPTAVGKTDLLCSFFYPNFEVINADSIQIYKGLDIGSAKADENTRNKIKHHLIDIIEPDGSYNVAQFVEDADSCCNEIWSRGNIPVISGGTAYYFKHFMYGLSDAPKSDEKVREEVKKYIENAGLSAAHVELSKVDSISASRIDPNDSYRISRALEVYKQTGRPLSSFALPNKVRNNMDILAIGLCRDREILRKRIEKRVDIMFEQGLVEEIKKFYLMGANLSWQSMKGIGYSEFFEELDNGVPFENLDLDSIKEKIIMDSIHYAKRQMTFFKSFANVEWIDGEDFSSIGKLVSDFLEH